MGYEIVCCSVCSAQIRGTEFESRRAFRFDGQPYCEKCAKAALKSLPPGAAQEILKQAAPPERSPRGKGSGPRIPPVPAASPPVPVPAEGKDRMKVARLCVEAALLVVAAAWAVWMVSSRSGSEPKTASSPPPAPPPHASDGFPCLS